MSLRTSWCGLRWRPWTRVSGAVEVAFQYRVVIALRNIPAHARNAETAQTILGRCCAVVQLTDLRDRPIEDDRELFVVAWCSHPALIEPKKLIFIPEPRVQWVEMHAQERVQRGLHYLVRVRIMAQQNFGESPGTPPDTDKEDDDQNEDNRDNDDRAFDYCPTPRRDSDDDSPDSDPRHGRHMPYCDYPAELPEDAEYHLGTIMVGQVPCLTCPLRNGMMVTPGWAETHLRAVADDADDAAPATPEDRARPNKISAGLIPDGAEAVRLAGWTSSTPSTGSGFVGRYLRIAPTLLHAGNCAPAEPRATTQHVTSLSHDMLQPQDCSVRELEEGHAGLPPWDWWAALVDAEFTEVQRPCRSQNT